MLITFRRSGLHRHVGTLAGGALISQVLNLALLPLLSRLFTPDDFRSLAVFSSVVAIASVAACMRLEIAIPLPESDREAGNLLALSLLSCTIFSTFAAIFVFSAAPAIRAKTALGPLELALLPIAIWLSGSLLAFQFWCTRKKSFSQIAKSRLWQAAIGGTCQIAFGAAGAGSSGLLLGFVANIGAGAVSLCRSAIRQGGQALRNSSASGMKSTLKAYKQYPLYSTIEALANTGGIQLPILLIAALSGREAGHLLLATRVTGIPLTLIGGAVAQVYLAHASAEMRSGHLASYTSDMIANLARLGAGPIIAAGLISPYVFPYVFGPNWGRAGEMVAWMTPWFVIQLITSPIAMSLHVLEAQRLALMLQVLGLGLRVGAVLLAYNLSPGYMAEAYAIGSFLFYGIYFFTVTRMASISVTQLASGLRRATPVTMYWCLTGIGAALLLNLFQQRHA